MFIPGGWFFASLNLKNCTSVVHQFANEGCLEEMCSFLPAHVLVPFKNNLAEEGFTQEVNKVEEITNTPGRKDIIAIINRSDKYANMMERPLDIVESQKNCIINPVNLSFFIGIQTFL